MTRDKVFDTCRWIILAPVTALVAFGVILLALMAVSESERPRFFGWEMFVVTSGSMTPNIDPGDVVMVDTGDSNPRVGDVITFRPSNDSALFITHRVVEVNQTPVQSVEYMTKGDANPSIDFLPVEATQVVGPVDAVLPLIGRLVLGMRDPRFVLIVGISVALAEWATALQRRERRTLPQQFQQ
jgi:signal peptidase